MNRRQACDFAIHTLIAKTPVKILAEAAAVIFTSS
jgi:hypothetical protein